MKKYLTLFVLPALACSAFGNDDLDCEAAVTTLEVNACIGIEVEQAEQVLEKYLEAAREKYDTDPGVQDSLSLSQEAWLAYRKAHCDAVYMQWIGGTIRGAMYGLCVLKLTKARTHLVWEDYLTYMDSSPPVLPEPEL